MAYNNGMNDKISPEHFVEVYELKEEKSLPQEECETLTLWVSREYKAKYNLAQARSKKKFGKFLKKVIEKTIDRVDLTKKAA